MNFWINFWTVFFIISLVLFAGLAVVVTIGGFFNIRSLFKVLTGRGEQTEDESIDEGG
jgi:hypothetical protein